MSLSSAGNYIRFEAKVKVAGYEFKGKEGPPFGNAGRELAQMGIRHARVYRGLQHAGARRESANLPR
jgi:hypothetical protein